MKFLRTNLPAIQVYLLLFLCGLFASGICSACYKAGVNQGRRQLLQEQVNQAAPQRATHQIYDRIDDRQRARSDSASQAQENEFNRLRQEGHLINQQDDDLENRYRDNRAFLPALR